jgi:hypothetical protein
MQNFREKPDFFETRQGFFSEKSQGIFEKSQDFIKIILRKVFTSP